MWNSLQEAYDNFQSLVSSLTSGVNDMLQAAQGAGVFRIPDMVAGNGGSPRDSADGFVGTPNLFTGIALLFPALTIGGIDYFLVGMLAGVIQIGLGTNGQIYWGAGKAVGSTAGLTLSAGIYPSSAYVFWRADDNNAIVGQILGTYAGAAVNSGLVLDGQAHVAGVTGFVILRELDSTGAVKNTFALRPDGLLLDTTARVGAVASQILRIATKTSSTNAGNNIVVLDTDTSGTAAAGLGSAILFRTRNAGGGNTMQNSGYFLSKWITPTVGAEDAQIDLAVMIAGVMTVVGSFSKNGFSASNMSGTNTGDQVIRSVLSGSGENGTVALSSTMFSGWGYSNTPQTSEADVAIQCPAPGTLRNFYFRTRLIQPATGALVVTVRVAAVDTPITITVTAGAAAGLFSDVTHTAVITAGQGSSIKLANGALAVSGMIGPYSVELDAS